MSQFNISGFQSRNSQYLIWTKMCIAYWNGQLSTDSSADEMTEIILKIRTDKKNQQKRKKEISILEITVAFGEISIKLDVAIEKSG